MGPHLKARALQKDKLHQADELIDILPEMQFRQLIATDDPIELIMGIQRSKVTSRVDRVAYATTPKFDIRNLKPPVPRPTI